MEEVKLRMFKILSTVSGLSNEFPLMPDIDRYKLSMSEHTELTGTRLTFDLTLEGKKVLSITASGTLTFDCTFINAGFDLLSVSEYCRITSLLNSDKPLNEVIAHEVSKLMGYLNSDKKFTSYLSRGSEISGDIKDILLKIVQELQLINNWIPASDNTSMYSVSVLFRPRTEARPINTEIVLKYSGMKLLTVKLIGDSVKDSMYLQSCYITTKPEGIDLEEVINLDIIHESNASYYMYALMRSVVQNKLFQKQYRLI